MNLTEKQQEQQKAFRAFAEREIAPRADVFDREQRLPDALIAGLASQGFLGATIPRRYGGQEMDAITYGLLNEELGRVSSSVRGLVMVQNMIAHTLVRWGSPQQQELWPARIARGSAVASLALTEPDAGSDVKSVRTTATRAGDAYSLRGHKEWISLGQIADVFLVLGRTERGLSAFLVERGTPGLEIEPLTDISGLQATMLAKLHLANCIVPVENLVGAEGFGLAPVVFTALDVGRYSIAWGCVGIGQACLDATLKHTAERKQFDTLLKDFQIIQSMVTDMIVNVKAARLLCMEAGRLRDVVAANAFVETMIAKYFASTMASQVARDAVQIHGAEGFRSSHVMQRHLRDAHVMEIIEGSTQILQSKIAEYSYSGPGSGA